MRSILDRSFRYTPSFDTDLRRTFDRIRRERREDRPIRSDAGASPAKRASAAAYGVRTERESMQPGY